MASIRKRMVRAAELSSFVAVGTVLAALATFSQTALAQIDPLTLHKNYIITGDYLVGGWTKTFVNGSPLMPFPGQNYWQGTITIPDNQSQATPPAPVPDGADILGAYLYWTTVESNQSSFAGQQGFFNGQH